MANIDHSRRAFFRRPAAPAVSGLPQRPPWALQETAFIEQCTRCHECITACEEDIIFIGDGGFPEIDFNRGECTFCEACVETCKPSALFKQVDSLVNQPAFYFEINIDDSCLAKQKTHCQSCKDVCDPSAITMPWPKNVAYGAIQIPEINIADCTSCGACISTCPSQSISITPIASPELKHENQ
jgi:ferredoxin-type protein NapF